MPHGIRIAELTTRIVQVIEVLRKLLKDFIAMLECQRVDGAVYLLYGEDDTGRSKVYIGTGRGSVAVGRRAGANRHDTGHVATPVRRAVRLPVARSCWRFRVRKM